MTQETPALPTSDELRTMIKERMNLTELDYSDFYYERPGDHEDWFMLSASALRTALDMSLELMNRWQTAIFQQAARIAGSTPREQFTWTHDFLGKRVPALPRNAANLDFVAMIVCIMTDLVDKPVAQG